MVNSHLPIVADEAPKGDFTARWWAKQPDGRILCQLCPRACRLKPGDRGFCFVRQNKNGEMVLDTYGRSTGFCIDPIEKKPLNHFLPGTPVLSFGTAGCNLGCKFCQNWDISKSREVSRISNIAAPLDIALAGLDRGCRSVAFTYNEPIIWAEYALDTAKACHELGLNTIAVTAGYLTDTARPDFFSLIDAANIDLKGFTEEFYRKLTGAHLQPILDTIRYAVHETDCWVELTNLMIPGANDHPDDLKRMIDWILTEVGCNVPIHFTAFHPDFQMRDIPATSHETLSNAYETAQQAGLNYVYVGNVHDVARQSTYCPACRTPLIQRDWHQLTAYNLDDNRCRNCDCLIPGRFEAKPGKWGRRRQSISIEPNATIDMDHASTGRPTPTEWKTADMNKATTIQALEPHELNSIHHAACQLVTAAVKNQTVDVQRELGQLADRKVSGIFVTLKRGNTLRGCCGMLGASISMAKALSDSATQTALHDPRMAPVTAIELPHLTLSVSVLGIPRDIGVIGEDRINAIKIGQHGLRIRHQGHAGLLLPVVAKERDWNARQFMEAVCTKAGLSQETWQREDALIEIFDGVDYSAAFMCMEPEPELPAVSHEALQKLSNWIASNLTAIQRGATPFYYATDVDDMTIAGVALLVSDDKHRAFSLMQLNIKEGIPLQSTLFRLTEVAAKHFQGMEEAGQKTITLAILSQLIHHGTAGEFDTREVDPEKRAILTLDSKRWSLAFDTGQRIDDLVTGTLTAERFRRKSTMIYSAKCDSTHSRFAISSSPSAVTQAPERAPAVAGSFYPKRDSEREQLINQILDDLTNQQKSPVHPQQVSAAMVPHAGLRYSGHIAADVWRRIDLPDDILIIGPKHTSDGVDWAVAPHETWALSDSTSLRGNLAFATLLADNVPGMKLDASAHRSEHGTEVQLPFLHRLAPNSRVTAIAMSGAAYEDLQAAARSLATLLKSLATPPLIVISSDMNHFADDVENRRRDQLALEKLAALDPEGLLNICKQEDISMCGQIPAAFVLLTLQYMQYTCNYQKIAYSTSAEATGDNSRVVGYAGVLF